MEQSDNLPMPAKKDRLTQAQIDDLYGVAGKMGYTEKSYRDLMKVYYGTDNTRKLTKKQGADFKERLLRGETVKKETPAS